jgi:hypothetical protein
MSSLEEKLLFEIENKIFNPKQYKCRSPRMIVIGDVHGCLVELKSLLVKCGYVLGDFLLLLGDLVGKGPNSADVVRMVPIVSCLTVLHVININKPFFKQYLS